MYVQDLIHTYVEVKKLRKKKPKKKSYIGY